MPRPNRVMLSWGMLFITSLGLSWFGSQAFSRTAVVEVIRACLISRDDVLTPVKRAQIASCLGWQAMPGCGLCEGAYRNYTPMYRIDDDSLRLRANTLNLSETGESVVSGSVLVQDSTRTMNADTAYIYRDVSTKQVNRILLIGNVRYEENGRLMLGRKVDFNPQDKSGFVDDVVYRLATKQANAPLEAWGLASQARREPNEDVLLKRATYTTCKPQDDAWRLEAKQIHISQAKKRGEAWHSVLKWKETPIFYFPYVNFPTTKDRQSGFLMPTAGYSNISGFNLAAPYYLNLAPNYDATITPELFTMRGVMVGGQFRYLSERSGAIAEGSILPHDRAFKKFINNNKAEYPELSNEDLDRWSVRLRDNTELLPSTHFHLDYQSVSDDYYLQDFTTNLALLTERQLLRQADIVSNTEHWNLLGMVQGYQTLQPVNQTPVSDIYRRLPELSAFGHYDSLPAGFEFNILGQYDQYDWPVFTDGKPQGPRWYANPALAKPYENSYFFFKPKLEYVGTHYDVRYIGTTPNAVEDRNLPRASLDTGLFFERSLPWSAEQYTQTLEPRLFYLNTPYQNQANIPVYDSAYMIFTTDQLFRNNRFSGYDRIGDSNQLAYAVTTRVRSEHTGMDKATLTVGQMRYFSNRRVFLCQTPTGTCEENPLTLGFLSPTAHYSPLATRGFYRLNRHLSTMADYVYDPAKHGTNNAQWSFTLEKDRKRQIKLGYTYLVNGDITQVGDSPIAAAALNQASVGFTWPVNDRWSSLGVYAYNISKGYEMMSLLGFQYDSCCWATRILGGRSYQSMTEQLRPQYANSIYIQFLWKGLGAVGNNSPTAIIRTFLPGYEDVFRTKI